MLEGKQFAVIFPHQTREGSSISKEIHNNDLFKIVGVFPRRPKLVSTSDNIITIKINDSIIDAVKESRKYNIPFIAGCPLAKCFWTLGESIVWIRLEKISKEKEIIVNIQNDNKYIQTIPETFKDKQELIEYIDKADNEFGISDAMEAIKQIKTSLNNRYGRPLFGNNYKPFYILIKTK